MADPLASAHVGTCREFDHSTAGSDHRATGRFRRRTGRVPGRGDHRRGLGPVFNGKSCAECHAVPSVGGSEPNLGVARETRIGRLFNGVFDPLDGSVSVNRGGGLLQQRAINLPGCHLKGEVVPPEATFVALRISTALFGAWLMEAIPDTTILGNISNGGIANFVLNPDTGRTELGRFGWKAQVATLHQFAGDAYLNEMGITNPSFP